MRGDARTQSTYFLFFREPLLSLPSPSTLMEKESERRSEMKMVINMLMLGLGAEKELLLERLWAGAFVSLTGRS